MKKIDDKKIKEMLKDVDVPISEDWFAKTRDHLATIAAEDEAAASKDQRSGFFIFNLFTLSSMSSSNKIVLVLAVAGLGLVLLAGGAYASDGARPGDALYPVDLASESVQRMLKFSDESKADFEMDVLDERMEELEELDEEGADEEVVDEALEEIAVQQERVQERVSEDNLTGSGDLERIRTRYELQLEEHLEYMYQMQEQKQTGTGSQNGSDEALEEAVDLYEAAEDELGNNQGAGGGESQGDGVQIQKQDQDQTNQNDDAPSGNGNSYGN